jgi:NAD(P)-dependent dehydrogenase (short-subunit alcohol dehydrogenase family)
MMKKKKLPEQLQFLENRKAVQKKSLELMTNKVCIITGATSGVGLEATKQLAKGKAHIVMVSRNPQKAEKIRDELQTKYNVQIDSIIADFSSLEDVRAAAKEILSRYPVIDVLINCAGMHSTKKTYTKEGFETVFCVNHLSSFLFTKLLLPRLIENTHARILQINSEGHRFNGLRLNDIHWKKRIYTGLRGYGASKTAQLLTVWELHDQLANTGVVINAMHPGDVKTAIGSNNGPLYRFFFRHITSKFLKDPLVSGESIYYLVADSQLQHVSGKFFHLTIEELPAKHARDRILGKQIYDLSMKLVGISE